MHEQPAADLDELAQRVGLELALARGDRRVLGDRRNLAGPVGVVRVGGQRGRAQADGLAERRQHTGAPAHEGQIVDGLQQLGQGAVGRDDGPDPARPDRVVAELEAPQAADVRRRGERHEVVVGHALAVEVERPDRREQR